MTTPLRHHDLPAALNNTTGVIVDAMIEVHRELGPGLLESLYVEALSHELQARGLLVRREVPVAIEYKGIMLGGGLRLDMLVEDRVIIEVKAIEQLAPVHFAQVDSYLWLAGTPLGFLVNFRVPLLKDGLHRRVNTRTASP